MVLSQAVLVSLMSWVVQRDCNTYYYADYSNPDYQDGWHFECLHDKENNHDQMNEIYTMMMTHMDGHLYQLQEQFRKKSLFVRWFQASMRPDNYWQWQEIERFDTGNYNDGGRYSEYALSLQP